MPFFDYLKSFTNKFVLLLDCLCLFFHFFAYYNLLYSVFSYYSKNTYHCFCFVKVLD